MAYTNLRYERPWARCIACGKPFKGVKALSENGYFHSIDKFGEDRFICKECMKKERK